MPQVNMALDSLGAVVVGIILFNLLMENVRNNRQRNCFIGMIAALLIILVTDLIDWGVNGHPGLRILLYISNTVNYAAGYVIVLFFCRYLAEFLKGNKKLMQRIIKILDVMCAASVMLLIINLFTGIFFTIDISGVYHRGGWYLLSQVYPEIALAANAVIITVWPGLSLSDRLVFATYPLFPFIGIVIDFIWHGWALTYVGAFLSVLIIYIQIYAARGKKLAEQENQLTQARINTMLSQIQPHFLYNTLSTIAFLCRKNPELAEKATIDFTEFLRGNMLSLNADKPISFKQELDHTKRYLELEKLRFGDNINIVFDIGPTLFRLPTLTLQPIVENAVRYGVTKRVDGGTVHISTQETEDEFLIKIADDGVGFDPEKPHDDGRTHIGIQNVRSRLGSMVGGRLEISSTPEVGTVAVITIPKEEE